MALISTLVQSLREVDSQDDILGCLQILLHKLDPDSEAGDCLLSACEALAADIKEAEEKHEADLKTIADHSWLKRQDDAVTVRGGL